MNTFFFAVPMRLVWDNWVKMMGEQNNPGDSTDYVTPQVVSPVGGYGENSIFDYFGLPTKVGGLSHSALPLRAYALIFNEWFRDENLQQSFQFSKGDGPDNPANFFWFSAGNVMTILHRVFRGLRKVRVSIFHWALVLRLLVSVSTTTRISLRLASRLLALPRGSTIPSALGISGGAGVFIKGSSVGPVTAGNRPDVYADSLKPQPLQSISCVRRFKFKSSMSVMPEVVPGTPKSSGPTSMSSHLTRGFSDLSISAADSRSLICTRCRRPLHPILSQRLRETLLLTGQPPLTGMALRSHSPNTPSLSGLCRCVRI